MVKSLEKRIIGGMLAIKIGKVKKNESNVLILLNQLKSLDEVLYCELVDKYKNLN